MSVAVLPQELIDHILDHLFDDVSSLRCCARVCSAWLPTSRFHLFAKVALKATSPAHGPLVLQERCKRLHAVLQQSPEIIKNITEFEICEGSPLHHPNPDEQGSTTWVTTERTLTALFRMLTHVRRFDFASTSTLHWTLFPPTFQVALHQLLSLDTLAYVRLHSWVFPNYRALEGLLSHCRHLRGLALSLTSVFTDTISSTDGPDLHLVPSDARDNEHAGGHADRARASVRPRPFSSWTLDDHADKESKAIELEALTLDHITFPHLEYWLLGRQALVSVSSLKELRVAHFQNEPSIVEKLLRAVGHSLEHFHLKPGSCDVYPFDLTHNPNLRSLRLTLDNPETAMSWAITIITFLVRAPPPPSPYGASQPHVRSRRRAASSASSSTCSCMYSCSCYRTFRRASEFDMPTSSRSDGSGSTMSSLTCIGLEFFPDPKKLEGWHTLDALFQPRVCDRWDCSECDANRPSDVDPAHSNEFRFQSDFQSQWRLRYPPPPPPALSSNSRYPPPPLPLNSSGSGGSLEHTSSSFLSSTSSRLSTASSASSSSSSIYSTSSVNSDPPSLASSFTSASASSTCASSPSPSSSSSIFIADHQRRRSSPLSKDLGDELEFDPSPPDLVPVSTISTSPYPFSSSESPLFEPSSFSESTSTTHTSSSILTSTLEIPLRPAATQIDDSEDHIANGIDFARRGPIHAPFPVAASAPTTHVFGFGPGLGNGYASGSGGHMRARTVTMSSNSAHGHRFQSSSSYSSYSRYDGNRTSTHTHLPLPTLTHLEIGLFALPSSHEFLYVQENMPGLNGISSVDPSGLPGSFDGPSSFHLPKSIGLPSLPNTSTRPQGVVRWYRLGLGVKSQIKPKGPAGSPAKELRGAKEQRARERRMMPRVSRWELGV